MVEQLRREFVQGPKFDLEGYLGYGGHGGPGSGGRVQPTQFGGVSGGTIDLGGGRSGGGGGQAPTYQPSAMDYFTGGLGQGAGQALATGIPEKIAQFQQEKKRERSLSAIDKALTGVDMNDPQSVLSTILNTKGVDPATREEVSNTYLAGQKAQNERMTKLEPQQKAQREQQLQEQNAPEVENALNLAYGGQGTENPQQQGQQQQPQQQQLPPEEEIPDQSIPQNEEIQTHQAIIQHELANGQLDPNKPLPVPKVRPPSNSFVSSLKVPSPDNFAKAIRNLPDAQKKIATTAYNKTQKMQYDEIQAAYKETEDYRDYVSDGYKMANMTRNTLQEMEDLVSSGQLSTPAAIKALQVLHIPLGSWNNPSNEIFEKYSNTLKQGVNDAYRGALRVIEIESFNKTIPTLDNSDEAKLEVIKKIKLENQIKEMEFDALNLRMTMNGGVPYRGIKEDVARDLAPQIDALYAQSREQPEEEQWVQMANIKTGQKVEVHPEDVEAVRRSGEYK